ncbi:MAG: HAMP domain-containing methyl-accepting chemotaxis protein [Cyanobacteria bacterium P01_D01_bin.156]
MTAQQYSLDKQPRSQDLERAPSQSSQSLRMILGQGQPISRRLIQVLLPVTLLPLAVASGLGIAVTRNSARDTSLALLKEKSFVASEAADIFVEDNFKIVESVLLSPSVVDALRQSRQDVEEDDLINQPIDALEQRFGQTKLLNPNALLNNYLSDVVEVEGMGELFFTESNGFNVAYSNVTSDFVQRDEEWWEGARTLQQFIDPIELDESAGVVGLSISKAITPNNSDEFLGVMKAVIPMEAMNNQIATYAATAISGSRKIQLLDVRSGAAFLSISADEMLNTTSDVDGGEAIQQSARALHGLLNRTTEDTDALSTELTQQISGKLIELDRIETTTGKELLTSLVEFDKKQYSLTTVPGTPWVAIASVSTAEINAAGNDLLLIFVLTAIVLGLAITFLLRIFAGQLSAPLRTLTETAQTAISGDLEARATPTGSRETQILGQSFNNLLEQIQTLLSRQQQLTEEQKQERETLENEITQLMEEVGDAADGDLSVRAKLIPGDVGIVADLFNAIIENLRDIAVNVKQSTGNVSQSLLDNEQQIRTLAEQALEEVRSLKDAMDAVQAMDNSIQTVASSANQASTLTNNTYSTAQAGSQSMAETANSILELRSTVGETAKKIKRLGESAQKIAQSVGLIDEIALKTNLLAVNASVEASRAGELGQGFTAVAEQVGALAEQSAGATKTIAQIVAEIQTETQEVVVAIETGTAQVVESSQRVEATQQQLEQVLAQSEQINQLMQGISASTADQTMVSKAVADLMQKATETSEKQSQSSTQVAQAIQETAQVAQELQASVEQFKVEN